MKRSGFSIRLGAEREADSGSASVVASELPIYLASAKPGTLETVYHGIVMSSADGVIVQLPYALLGVRDATIPLQLVVLIFAFGSTEVGRWPNWFGRSVRMTTAAIVAHQLLFGLLLTGLLSTDFNAPEARLLIAVVELPMILALSTWLYRTRNGWLSVPILRYAFYVQAGTLAALTALFAARLAKILP